MARFDLSKLSATGAMMPIRDRIIWGRGNPFSDPRLKGLDQLIRDIRRHNRLPPNVAGGRVFYNLDDDLPIKAPGYYREYDVHPPTNSGRGRLRIVLGNSGEVYITGNHYRDFRQIVDMPE